MTKKQLDYEFLDTLFSMQVEWVINGVMNLSIQLPFTIFLQVKLTSSEKGKGKYKNPFFMKYLLLLAGTLVSFLNILLFIILARG